MPTNMRRRAPRSTASSLPRRSRRAASPRWMCATPQNAPGVRLVLTKDNAPAQHPFGPVDLPDRFARALPALNNDEVPYFGFPVAFVVADTLEQATAAAAMVRVRYAPLRGAYDLHAAGPTADQSGPHRQQRTSRQRDRRFRQRLRQCGRSRSTRPTPRPISIRRRWSRMRRWRCGMAPKLTVYTAAQLTTSPQEGLARTFNMPQGGCAHHHALYRRRLRQQVAVLLRGDAGRDGRAHAEAAGEGRNDAPAALPS